MSAKSSTPIPTTPEVTHAKTPSAPKKAAKKEKVVKEKVVKEKVVKEKVVKEKKEKVVKEKAVKKAKKEEVQEEVKEEVKKTRPATLPAKYNKFIQYSYYLIRALNNASLEKHGEELLDEELFFNEAHVFGDVKTQEEFVTSFLENKSIGKEMKTHVADKKKAAAKAEKEAVKAAAKAEKQAAKAAAKAEKQAGKTTKPKKEKKEKNEEKDLVTSLVTLANSDEAVPEAAAENVEEEEELDVQMFEHEGKEYLIDDSNTLYDVDNHTVVGTWDKENKHIIIAK